jgi:predicted enzyme related to lactoylglutathione lyase
MNKFVHVELNTSDVKAAKKFYKGVFGDWKLQDMPMGPMTYTMIDTGAKNAGGGMQQKPMPEAPTQWLPYVEVDSVKRAIAKARKRGATIVVEFQAVGTMGALGIFIDPTGAALGVWETTKKPAKKPAKKKK